MGHDKWVIINDYMNILISITVLRKLIVQRSVKYVLKTLI